MDAAFLIPETTVHAAGEGAPLALGDSPPATLLVTLGITHVVEQEALMVSIQGSTDGSAWNGEPLASYSQKFYPGVSTVLVNLLQHPDIRFIRAQWKAQRWGRGDKNPNFTFYVFAEPA